MQSIGPFLQAIPTAAKNPYALIAYTITALLFIISSLQRNQLKLVLAEIRNAPTKDKITTIETVLNTRLPKDITADQYLRQQRMKYIFLAFFGVLITAGAISTMALVRSSVPVDSSNALEAQIRQHLMTGYYSEALSESRQFIQDAPKNPAAYQLEGYAHIKLHEYDSALQSFQKSLDLDPTYYPALSAKGSALLHLGDYKGAQEIFETLKTTHPDDLIVRYNLAGVEMVLGLYQQAETELNYVYNSPSGQAYRGETALGLGISEMLSGAPGAGHSVNSDSPDAIAHFQQAVCLRPDLRGVFLGERTEDPSENYEDYISLIKKFSSNRSYAKFVRGLRAGKTC